LAEELELPIFATPGTAEMLKNVGIDATVLSKDPDAENSAVKCIADGKVDLVINVPKSYDEAGRPDGYAIRRRTVDAEIPLITDLMLARALVDAMRIRRGPSDLGVVAWNDFLARKPMALRWFFSSSSALRFTEWRAAPSRLTPLRQCNIERVFWEGKSLAGTKLGEAFAEHKSHDDELKVGSDRSFGVVFTVFFGIVGALPLLSKAEPRLWAFGVSGVFLLVALAMPKVLHPLNVLWMKFGALLSMIVSPIVLGLLFFTTIMPIGLIMRLAGKDLLSMKFDKNAKSYWVDRDPPGPPPESMSNQFWVTERDEGTTMSFIKEMWAFLKHRKKFWLLPIIIMMVIFGGLLVLAQGSAVAPFIYTLF
jgi:hypothetical protein